MTKPTENGQEALANLSLTDVDRPLESPWLLHLAQSQLTLARRLHTEALVFLDLDDFKTINDTFGHGNGDRALVDFAGLLKNTYRESDIIARPAETNSPSSPRARK